MPKRSVAQQLQAVVGALPQGEVREGQLQMAEVIASTLAAGTHVAVTAGTGTGKSFGYLVPAIMSQRRVLVATATKALQDQLANKDLGLVAQGLKPQQEVRWAVLKGRSNYLCRQRIAEMRSGAQGSLEDLLPTEREGLASQPGSVGEQVARLVEWSSATKTGDRAELDFEPQPRAWSAVSVGSDECPGMHRCPEGADCFTELARAKAALADVVVVNLHLLGAHLRSGGAVLPEFEALVVDEAHELEDVLASSLGIEVSPGRLRALAAMARSVLPGSADAVEGVMAAAIRVEESLLPLRDKRLPVGLGSVAEAARLAVNRLVALERQLRAAGQDGDGATAAADKPPRDGTSEQGQGALRSLLAVERCREELDSLLIAGAEEVVWVTGGDRPALRSAPLDVSSVVRAQLFEHVPVVMTSATLPPGLPQRLGAPPEDVTELDVGSPFDYKSNALLYCATDIGDRRREGAEAAIHEEMEQLVRAAGGRTLGLFTSYRAMTAAADALRDRIEWPIHTQGDLPKPALLQAFATEEAACLFATMGFWQGVDVPGPTLSLVVIDRLPFPRPDDPLMSARRDAAGGQGFRAVDLPRAATLLAQGAGRLIRTADDRGVVAVLDSRLAIASYAGYLLKALPPMRRTRDRQVAVQFLRDLHAGQ
ncbi:MAG: ATP-dependent DNA helicase [Acidimicrobiales bacterium]